MEYYLAITDYNMDEPCKHYATWKEPDTTEQILYGSIYMRCPE